MEEIIKRCKEKNSTVRKHLEDSQRNKSLLSFVHEEMSKKESGQAEEGYSPSELTEIIVDYIRVRSGEAIAKKAAETLKSNTLLMADHYGGIYSTQSFQGDLLYIKGLKEAGVKTEAVPILACAQVPLNNSTFPRGMILYDTDEAPLKLPVTNAKNRVSAACAVKGFDADDVNRFIKRIRSDVPGEKGEALLRLSEEIYKREEVLRETDFRKQMYYVGKDVMERCLDGETVLFVDFEEVFGKLFLKDLKRTDSLCFRILYDRNFRNALKEEMPEMNLFVGIDGEGKSFPLVLGDDGFLRGKTRGNEEVVYNTDEGTLQELIKSGKIFVSLYVCIVLSAFQRGMTLFGGIFQSVYLNEWKQKTMAAMKRTGCEKEAERIGTVPGDGYISGPIFALTKGCSGLVNAGPLEMILQKKTLKDIEHLISETTVFDAHVMGMYEFYNDLTTADEKCGNWYQALTKFYGEAYEKNGI